MKSGRAPATGITAAGLLFGLVWLTAPLEAGRLYESLLADCRAAAEKANDPTLFKCDWNGLAASAPEGAFDGRFSYSEVGLSGTLTILDSNGKAPALVDILTVSEDPNTHTCSAEIVASHDGDALVARPEEAEGCEITITRGAGPGTVMVKASDACRTYYCGMRAAFDGNWIREAKK